MPDTFDEYWNDGLIDITAYYLANNGAENKPGFSFLVRAFELQPIKSRQAAAVAIAMAEQLDIIAMECAIVSEGS